jgi:hypothetical protein
VSVIKNIAMIRGRIIIAANGKRLAAVPAFLVRQLKFITNDE